MRTITKTFWRIIFSLLFENLIALPEMKLSIFSETNGLKSNRYLTNFYLWAVVSYLRAQFWALVNYQSLVYRYMGFLCTSVTLFKLWNFLYRRIFFCSFWRKIVTKANIFSLCLIHLVFSNKIMFASVF